MATIQVNVCQMGSAVRNRMILLKQFYCKHAPPDNQHIQIRQGVVLNDVMCSTVSCDFNQFFLVYCTAVA